MIKKICEFCSKEFIADKNKRIYCSRKCHYESIVINELRKGENNPMWKVKRPDLSERNKDPKNREACIKARIGSKHSEETKRFIGFLSRQSRLKEGNWKKEKNPSWKGGISTLQNIIRTSKRYKEWRHKVFMRDMWTCQNCKNVGGILNVHHIKSVKECLKNNDMETLFSIDNGITLCKECHKLTDNYAKP